MSNQSSPTSCPPSAEPALVTPGPRAAAFITLYHSALKSTIKAISYESFAACFPLIAKRAPEALQVMWQGMRDGLEGFAVKEFEMIMQERDVISRLNALETIIADANRRKEASVVSGDAAIDVSTPPHKLQPEPLLAAHLAPFYVSQQSQLNAKLQTVQSLNAGLMSKINEQRKEIAALLVHSENLVGDVEGAASVLKIAQGLGKEARKAETILAETELC